MLWTKFNYENKQRAITQKLSKSYHSCALRASLMRCIHPQNFLSIANSFGDMLWRKFKYGNKQRVKTPKLSKQELWFMCTALPLDKIYLPTKFHNHS